MERMLDSQTIDIIKIASSVLTAFGTVGAVVISLYFSMRPLRERISVSSDIVYICYDKNGIPAPYVISAQSAQEEHLRQCFSKWEKSLRLTVHNKGDSLVQINGFFLLNIKNRQNTLFIDSSKCKNGNSISNPIQPKCHFTMFLPIQYLKSKNIAYEYIKTKKPNKNFRVAAETTTGNLYTSRLSPAMHKIITDALPEVIVTECISSITDTFKSVKRFFTNE
jgi:hypothetical protein